MEQAIRINIDKLDEEYTDSGVLLFTLKGKPFNGVAYELGPEGNLWSEQSYENGILDGSSKVWHPNGQLRSQTEYKWNRVHGKDQEWHENGQLKHLRVSELGSVLREQQWDEQGKLLKTYDISGDAWAMQHLESQRELFKMQGIHYQFLG